MRECLSSSTHLVTIYFFISPVIPLNNSPREAVIMQEDISDWYNFRVH